MKRRAIVLFMLLLPLLVWGQDNNGTDTNIVVPTVSHTVVTVQIDKETRDKIDRLDVEIQQLQITNQRLQEKFAQMNIEIKNQFIAVEKSITINMTANLTTLVQDQTKELKAWVQLNTNPVKQNLPVIFVFMLMTGAFLLLATRKGGK